MVQIQVVKGLAAKQLNEIDAPAIWGGRTSKGVAGPKKRSGLFGALREFNYYRKSP